MARGSGRRLAGADTRVRTDRTAGIRFTAVLDSVPSSSASEAPRLRPDRDVYTVRADGQVEKVSIPFTYCNWRRDSVYHPTCRPNEGEPTVAIAIEKLVSGEWKTAWAQALPGCLSEPLIIEPGETFSDTLDVVLHPQDSVPYPLLTPLVDIEGTYRLVWQELLRSYDPERSPFGEPLPLQERGSGTFQLRRQRTPSGRSPRREVLDGAEAAMVAAATQKRTTALPSNLCSMQKPL